MSIDYYSKRICNELKLLCEIALVDGIFEFKAFPYQSYFCRYGDVRAEVYSIRTHDTEHSYIKWQVHIDKIVDEKNGHESPYEIERNSFLFQDEAFYYAAQKLKENCHLTDS